MTGIRFPAEAPEIFCLFEHVRTGSDSNPLSLLAKEYNFQGNLYVGVLISLWLSEGILFLQDNAAPHKAAIAHQKLAGLHLAVLKHPAYSPDLAPSDCYLFPNLKEHLMTRKFSSTEEATLAADGCFAAQPKKIFLGWVKEVTTTES
jgi:transposase